MKSLNLSWPSNPGALVVIIVLCLLFGLVIVQARRSRTERQPGKANAFSENHTMLRVRKRVRDNSMHSVLCVANPEHEAHSTRRTFAFSGWSSVRFRRLENPRY